MEILEEEYKPCAKEIGNLLQENTKAEADAVMDYTHFLEELAHSDLDKKKKEKIQSEIYEIIGDELNHQERLKMLYSLVTDIKQAKD